MATKILEETRTTHTFDVPVDDHVAVQVGHALQDLPGVAARHVLRQRPVRLQLVLDGALNTTEGGQRQEEFREQVLLSPIWRWVGPYRRISQLLEISSL